MMLQRDLEGRAEALRVERGSLLLYSKKELESPHSAKLKETYFKKTDFLKQISHPTLLA